MRSGRSEESVATSHERICIRDGDVRHARGAGQEQQAPPKSTSSRSDLLQVAVEHQPLQHVVDQLLDRGPGKSLLGQAEHSRAVQRHP